MRDDFFFCFLALCYELMKSAACWQQQPFLKIEKTFRIQAAQQKKPFLPGTKPPHASAAEKSARARSARTLAATGKDSL